MCLRNVSSSAGGKVGPPQRLQCIHSFIQSCHCLIHDRLFSFCQWQSQSWGTARSVQSDTSCISWGSTIYTSNTLHCKMAIERTSYVTAILSCSLLQQDLRAKPLSRLSAWVCSRVFNPASYCPEWQRPNEFCWSHLELLTTARSVFKECPICACVCVSPLESRGSFWIVLFLHVLLAGGRDTTGISRPTKRVPVGADAVGDTPLRTCSRF